MAESNYEYFIRTGNVKPKAIPGLPDYAQPGWVNPNTPAPKPSDPYAGAPDYARPGWTRTVENQASYEAAQARADASSGGSGGSSGGGRGGSTGSTSSPSGPTPWSVATKNGLTGGDTVPGLNHAINNFNKNNGTNYQMNSSGHIRQNGSGAYMTQSESDSFMASIPTNAVDYKYGIAIDKAIAGDSSEMKNLDRFFTGAERPAIGYTRDWLVKEREAKSLGISMEDLDRRNAIPVATPVVEVQPIVAATAPVPVESVTPPVQSTAAPGTSPEYSDTVNSIIQAAADAGLDSNSSINSSQSSVNTPTTRTVEPVLVTQNEAREVSGVSNQEDKTIISPDHVRIEESLAKRTVDPAALAARKSAIESRLQKIAAERQPYGGTAGATSVVKDNGFLVPPPIAGGGASQNGLPTLP